MNLLKIAAGGAFALLVVKLINYTSLAANLVTRVTGFRIVSLDLTSGLTIGVTASVSNPTSNTVTITQPFVVLTSKGSALAQSIPSGATTTIQGQAVTNLPEIQIRIGLTSALMLFGSNITATAIIAAYKSGFKTGSAELLRQIKMPLEVAVSFYADGLFVKVPPQPVIY